MANPMFTDENGANQYIWEELPNLPSDRFDLSVRMSERNYTIEHQRNKITFARAIIAQLGDWRFFWIHITRSMISNINYFYGLNRFRYYPDSDSGTYWPVFMIGDFRPKNQRGGGFNLEIRLQEL